MACLHALVLLLYQAALEKNKMPQNATAPHCCGCVPVVQLIPGRYIVHMRVHCCVIVIYLMLFGFAGQRWSLYADNLFGTK
jgi:hypothetical protein